MARKTYQQVESVQFLESQPECWELEPMGPCCCAWHQDTPRVHLAWTNNKYGKLLTDLRHNLSLLKTPAY